MSANSAPLVRLRSTGVDGHVCGRRRCGCLRRRHIPRREKEQNRPRPSSAAPPPTAAGAAPLLRRHRAEYEGPHSRKKSGTGTASAPCSTPRLPQIPPAKRRRPATINHPGVTQWEPGSPTQTARPLPLSSYNGHRGAWRNLRQKQSRPP